MKTKNFGWKNCPVCPGVFLFERVFHFLLLTVLIAGCAEREMQNDQPLQSPNLKIGDFPQLMVDGAIITQLAKEPEIVTPTGVAVDDLNRIWVIENHTHVRQDDYVGPAVDRILVFSGYNHVGAPESITEFATDFVDGMSLSLTQHGTVLITTRAAIIEFTDLDGDNVADKRDTLVSLLTDEDFPHNGLSGLALGPDGKIYFQCGENFGADYELTGSDDISLFGKEREGGSLYRCHMDGSRVERIGTAIWNCFAMTFDDYGNLFAVENDPDSRPPCRLLHIVKGGNYGFQFQHGRDGLSPLTSWFGEIPGTLPMVAGTGEAPSGVLYYSLEDFGDSRQGSLLVTAWGDNEIQSFKLQKKGSSFTAEAESLVKGARDFYPVGIALDHDGGIIATDWASVSYAVHGQGRIWKIKGIGSYSITAEMAMVANRSATDLVPALLSPDVRLRTKAAEAMVSKYPADLPELIQSDQLSGPAKMSILWSAQSNQSTILPDLLQLGMQEENELLRSAIVRMKVEGNSIADETFFQNVIENDPSPFVVREAIYGLHSKSSFEQVVDFFERDDPFIHIAIIATFGRSENCDFLLDFAKDENAYIRLGALLCLRHSGSDVGKSAIPAFLEDPRMENRIVVLKWIAEDNLKNFRQNVEESFANVSDISPELFEAYVVTFQYLDGEFNQQSHFMEGDEHVSNTFYKRQKFLLSTAKNTNLNDEIRTRALSAVNPNHEDLSLEDLQLFVSESDTGLQIESVRSVGQREEDAAIQILKRVSNDRSLHLDVRMEAVAGLSRTANINELSKSVLLNLLEKESDNLIIREEAIRSLQEQADDPKIKPWIDEYVQSLPATDLTASDAYWRSIAKEEGNPIAGARTFFNKRYQCGSCHRIDGRGGIFGPDLSKVGSNATRERIVESILVPDDVITPVYAGYEVLDSSGQTVVGRLDRDLDSKRHLQMILADGERKAVAYASIAKQSMLENSLMPINLHRLMSPVEFRDLVQYLVDKK